VALEVTFTVEGQAAFVDHLMTTSKGTQNLSISMSSIGLYLTRFYSGEVFVSRGGIIGEQWPALNPNYAVWKARKFPGRPPLIESGKMNANFKFDSDNNSVRIFNPTPYFKYHQSGESRGGNLPRRVMIKIDEMRRQEVLRIIQAEITKKVGA
jgi:phage gpG-like protein